jgi:hypothetical protein
MVMRVMLIGLLVIGTVSMLETHVNAAEEFQRCCWCRMSCVQFLLTEKSEKVVAEVVAEAKKHEGSEVWLIGFTDPVGPSKEYDRVEHEMDDVREMLIQHDLQPDIIRSLILEGYAPLDPKQRGIKAIVTWPKRQYQ